MSTVSKEEYERLKAEKDSLFDQLTASQEKVRTFAEMKPTIEELKKEFKGSKKWNAISPLVGVVVGSLLAFLANLYNNKSDKIENQKQKVQTLYHELVFDFSKYTGYLREYHKTQLILSFETAVLEKRGNEVVKTNPKILFDPKTVELKQYNQRRMDEKIRDLNDFDAKIRSDFKSLIIQNPRLQELDSVLNRLLYYKARTAESIGRTNYDVLLKNYNSEELDEDLGEDMFQNFEQPKLRFLRDIEAYTPELNKTK